MICTHIWIERNIKIIFYISNLIDKKLNRFEKKGFYIEKENINKNFFKKIRTKIFIKSKKILKIKTKNEDNFFNNFHKFKVSATGLNSLRQNLNFEINKKNFAIKHGYKALRAQLISLLGPDIVAQNRVNLVIQKPGDVNQVTLHRDAPPNSPYEIVVWVPLTKVFKTKNMYVLEKKETIKLLNNLRSLKKKKKDLLSSIFKRAEKKATKNKMNFGEALFFSTSLFHLVPVNREKETRWSLNFRFKSLYSPYGQKRYPEFFDIIEKSSVSNLALEFICNEKKN